MNSQLTPSPSESDPAIDAAARPEVEPTETESRVPRPGFLLFMLIVLATLCALAVAYRQSGVHDRSSADRLLGDSQLQLDHAKEQRDAAIANLAAQRHDVTVARDRLDAARRNANVVAARASEARAAADTVLTSGGNAAALALAMEQALRNDDISLYDTLRTTYNATFGPVPSPYSAQLLALSRLITALTS